MEFDRDMHEWLQNRPNELFFETINVVIRRLTEFVGRDESYTEIP
jgi:hypothetical protein